MFVFVFLVFAVKPVLKKSTKTTSRCACTESTVVVVSRNHVQVMLTERRTSLYAAHFAPLGASGKQPNPTEDYDALREGKPGYAQRKEKKCHSNPPRCLEREYCTVHKGAQNSDKVDSRS